MRTATLPSRLDRALAGWLERGAQRIGQIAILRPLSNDAAVRFELRHHDERDAAAETLALHGDPEDAVALALHDDAGNYRPLKTAPNLRHGWRLTLANLTALRLALDGGFYPARLAALLAWEEGRLHTTPLRTTLGRQTGMYRVTKLLTDPQADALAGNFCRSDGGCLRTILWKRDAAGAPASSQLPPEKFEPAHDQTGRAETTGAVLPLLCQEPCNLLVAAARTVVKESRKSGAGPQGQAP